MLSNHRRQPEPGGLFGTRQATTADSSDFICRMHLPCEQPSEAFTHCSGAILVMFEPSTLPQRSGGTVPDAANSGVADGDLEGAAHSLP